MKITLLDIKRVYKTRLRAELRIDLLIGYYFKIVDLHSLSLKYSNYFRIADKNFHVTCIDYSGQKIELLDNVKQKYILKIGEIYEFTNTKQ